MRKTFYASHSIYSEPGPYRETLMRGGSEPDLMPVGLAHSCSILAGPNPKNEASHLNRPPIWSFVPWQRFCLLL
ncbi:hypothetical protein EDE09_102502 [Neorhizobium sp. S3-V5DH]|nr:hypothetical protein EDE09_102502 [Neorhizobium sp. S3-V5DH]